MEAGQYNWKQNSVMTDKKKTTVEPNNSEKVSTTVPGEKTAPKPDKKSAKHVDEKKPAKPATQDSKKTTTPTTRRSSNAVAWLALILSGGLIAASWYGWQLYQSQQQALTDTQTAQVSLSESLNNQIKTLQQLQQTQASQLAQQQETLLININEVNSRLGNTTRDWMLSEAHYLLQLGNQQAQLAHNIPTAIVALQLADKRLHAVGEPALLEVRKQITRELNSLKALEQIDVNSIILTLGEFAAQSHNLKLNADTLPQPGETKLVPEKTGQNDKTENWQAFVSAIWSALKSLVTVRYHDEAAQPLLTPAHAQAIRDSLELKLNQARLAALQQNTPVFQDSIKHSIEWLQRYFVSTEAATINMLTSLKKWQTSQLSSDIPDISRSRRLLVNAAARLNMKIQNQPEKPAVNEKKKTS